MPSLSTTRIADHLPPHRSFGSRQELLRLPGRLGPRHLPFPLAARLMRILRPVVEVGAFIRR
jgi:hypothetical protein